MTDLDIEQKIKNFTPSQLAYLKEYLESDFYYHTQFFLALREHQNFIEGRHHPIMIKTLEKVFEGEIKRLIINIPPSYTKTEIAVIQFCNFGFAFAPDSRFLHISGGDTLPLDNSSKIKEQLMHPISKKLWGYQLKDDAKAKGLWKTNYGGQFYAVSSGGQVMGFRAGRSLHGFHGAILIDDPQKPEDMFSEKKRMAFPDHYLAKIRYRIDNRDVPVIVIMQRIHELDFCGWLLNGGSGEFWHHLCLPNPIP